MVPGVIIGPPEIDERARHVRRPEEELRPVPREDRRVPAPFLRGDDEQLGLRLRVALHRSGGDDDLTAHDLVTTDAAEKQPAVLTRTASVWSLWNIWMPVTTTCRGFSSASTRPTISTVSPTGARRARCAP